MTGPIDPDAARAIEGDRRRRWQRAAGALAAGIIVGVIVALVASGGDDKPEATTTTSSSTTTSSTTTSTTLPTTTTTRQLPPIPGQVLNLTAGPGGGSGEVSLRWDAVPGAASYRIYRSGTMGTSGALVATVDTNEYLDVPGVHSYYTVSAVNAAGEGPKSAEKCGAVVGDPC